MRSTLLLRPQLRGLLGGRLLGPIRCCAAAAAEEAPKLTKFQAIHLAKERKRHNYDKLPEHVIPWEERKPFSQKNRRRDDVLVPRHAPGVPETTQGFVQAWLSSWGQPRTGIVPLRADVWTMPLRPDIVFRVVHWQRACLRVGLAQTKGRGDVRGGNKKPRPQKGTGKSRQGSIRAPQWRGGGRAFPKRPKSYKYFLQRKVQTLGLKVALSYKYHRGALVVMEDLAVETHKTAPMRARLTVSAQGRGRRRAPPVE